MSKSVLRLCPLHDRFSTKNRHSSARIQRPFRANFGLVHRSKTAPYSMTSSARASSVGGTSSPSALAVLRLMTASYLVGACTGRSARFDY
jgi:hypothetical protein